MPQIALKPQPSKTQLSVCHKSNPFVTQPHHYDFASEVFQKHDAVFKSNHKHPTKEQQRVIVTE